MREMKWRLVAGDDNGISAVSDDPSAMHPTPYWLGSMEKRSPAIVAVRGSQAI